MLAQPVVSPLAVNVGAMTRLTHDDLQQSTLRRQFPAPGGTDAPAVEALYERLGPVQSQVPRAPFLHAASRLPGVSYATLCALFESHRLLKASLVRGTVHTSGRAGFARLVAIASRARAGPLRNALALQNVLVSQLNTEVERFCAEQWRSRDEILAQLRSWLAEHESAASAARLEGSFAESLVWGHSALLRRPKDQSWEKRTDTYRRTAASLLPELTPVAPEQALVELVRTHLLAYGPLAREDLAFFFGVGLGQVEGALATLGDEVVRHPGPDAGVLLDLAEPPVGGGGDPGLRLLPEFDGLLLAFCGRNRTRFVDEQGLGRIWARTNGVFAPVVLHQGRLVATWRTLTHGRRTDIEVTMLGRDRLTDDLLTEAAGHVGTALDLAVTEVRVVAG